MSIDIRDWLLEISDAHNEHKPHTAEKTRKRGRVCLESNGRDDVLPSPKSGSTGRGKWACLETQDEDEGGDIAIQDDVNRTPRATRRRVAGSASSCSQSNISDANNQDSRSASGRSSAQSQFAKLELGDKKVQPGVLSTTSSPAPLKRWLNQIRAYSSGRGILAPLSFVRFFFFFFFNSVMVV